MGERIRQSLFSYVQCPDKTLLSGPRGLWRLLWLTPPPKCLPPPTAQQSCDSGSALPGRAALVSPR